MKLGKWPRKRTKIAPLIVCIAAAIGGALYAVLHASATLPYHDSFASGDAEEWEAFGGTWDVNGGAVYNRSDERGAKLVSGSPDWSDYQLTADLRLIGHEGDIGLNVRVGDEERGVDSYRGYYVGLRSADSALVIGRADHGWMEGQPVPMQGGVKIGPWYRLHVVAFGCHIGAEATNIETNQTSWAAFVDHPCFRKGKIGLRSMGTGGAWRNVCVTSVTEQAWERTRSHAGFVTQPDFPGREADYSRMREMDFKNTYVPVRSYRNRLGAQASGGLSGMDIPQIASIDSVRTPPMRDETVTIRGVVTLTSPLYVQDSSGSIAVESTKPAELNLGDEVEISGKSTLRGFTPEFDASDIRLLWDRTLVVPMLITSTEAASGAFDASLVELRGILESKTKSADNVITLSLYDSAQKFSAMIHGGLSTKSYESWTPGSVMSIGGICTVPASGPAPHTAFTILLRASDDVQVLTGPPWWTGWQLVRLLSLSFFLVCFGVFFYFRLERWKLRAITSERDRLSHELHDTMAQGFAGIGFHLQGLYNGLRSGTSDHAMTVAMLHDACDMVAHSHREASAAIAALQPDADQGLDFLVALDRATREMLHSSRSEMTLPLKFVREGVPQPISMPVRDALFHIGREAINNMVHHSRATEMAIKLRYAPKGLTLEARDNGIGFSQEPGCAGLGIRGMRLRCNKIGARLEILSTPGKGTCITVHSSYGLRPRLIDWIRSVRQRIAS